MIDNPYSPPESNSKKSAGEDSVGPKILAWALILIGAYGLLNVIVFLYEKVNEPNGDAYLFSVQSYAMFLVPSLAIQTGLLVKSGSKWAIATCCAILAMFIYVFLKLYFRFPMLDQRSIFTQIADQMPRALAIHIIGYAFVLGFLLILWRAGKLK